MKKFILFSWIIALLFGFLSSCSPHRIIAKKEGCDELAKHIKNGWVSRNENQLTSYSAYYKETGVNLFKELTWNHKCIRGLTKEQITKVFGDPHFEQNDTYHYYLSKGCFAGLNNENCTTFFFTFDAHTGGVVRLGEKIPDHRSH